MSRGICDEAKARLAATFNSAAFWSGCIAARSTEDRQRHDEGIARLRALREAAESGQDVTAMPEFDRWLAY
ncbi:MAG TPA: hypothetical protein VN663_23110 [Ramlibacter sp.]|nr:hypothetical protein [Ramlibacter sp.]